MADQTPDPDSDLAAAEAEPAAAAPAEAAVPAPAPAPAAAPPQGESRTTRLYRAALGPVNTERYLQVFERFDALGRRRLVWNPAAGLFTLGWLVFRQLWTEALGYAVLVTVAVGLYFGVWPLMQTWPTGVRWGLLASWMLLGVLLPGLLGDGWLHRQVQRRLLRVVAASESMDEARAALARQAATHRRLWWVVVAHAAVLGALWLAWDHGQVPATTGKSLTTLAQTAPTEAAASPPVARQQAPVAPAATVRLPIGGQAGAEVDGAAASSVPVSEPDPPVRPKPETDGHALAPPAPPKAPVPAQAAPATAVPTPPAVPLTRQRAEPAAAYAINVGLFADAGNARRAQQRLQQAGLPVVVQTLSTPQGPRTRVRVGPYPQREAADAAAQRIRALGLEAVVFRP